MQFFTRIISQWMGSAMSDRLANTKWMQSLAQHTHKGIEKTAKMAVDNQEVLKETQKSFLETTQQLRKDAGNSPMGQYFSGLAKEVSDLKSQIKNDNSNKK